jgi:hypothetical protein
MTTKKHPDALRENNINQAKREVLGFEELIDRFAHHFGFRKPKYFRNYSLHVASIALYFGKIPTEFILSKYMTFVLSSKVKPPQTYFKHSVYVQFLLK